VRHALASFDLGVPTFVKKRDNVADAYFLTVLGVGAGEPFFKRVLSRITFPRLLFVNIASGYLWFVPLVIFQSGVASRK
jgi:hypothetical protein